MPRGRLPNGEGFGRPSKGARGRLCTRVDPELTIFASVEAKRAGQTINDWLGDLLRAEQERRLDDRNPGPR